MGLPAPRKLYAKDFAELGVHYSQQLTLDPAIDRSRILEAVPGYETDATIARFTTAIKNGYQAPLYLKYINEQVGYGTFTDTVLKENDIVGEYTGHVIMSDAVRATLPKDRAFMMQICYCYADYYWPAGLYIDAKEKGNLTRFINHSYKPNVVHKQILDGGMWHVILVAATDIAQDKQLFIDYGKAYWIEAGAPPSELDQT